MPPIGRAAFCTAVLQHRMGSTNADSSTGTPAGRGKAPVAGSTTCSANPPRAAQATAVPGDTPATSGPMASTTPPNSWPSTAGGSVSRSSPSMAWTSVRQTPQACTRTRTWPGPGAGAGRSSIRNSRPPVQTAQRIPAPPAA